MRRRSLIHLVESPGADFTVCAKERLRRVPPFSVVSAKTERVTKFVTCPQCKDTDEYRNKLLEEELQK